MAPDITFSEGLGIGPSFPCFIIAEIGQNHQGELEIAQQLMREAKNADADCVKFQKCCLTEKFNPSALDQPYESPNSWGPTYREHKMFLEFSEEQFEELEKYACEIGIPFTSSASDLESLKFLGRFNVPFIKIGSGDADNYILLEAAAKLGKPLIISTGMSDMDGVVRAHDVVSRTHKEFVLMHCVSAYPTQPKDSNLKVLDTFASTFPDINIGYSGHEVGYNVTLAAVAKGAKVVERHITLDKSLKGSDHTSSLNPQEFASMVQGIREVEAALGSGVKAMQTCEEATYTKLGKGLVAKEELKVGDLLTLDKLAIKVALPKGVPARQMYQVLGATVTTPLLPDQSIEYRHLQL